MLEPEVLLDIAQGLLAENPDPVVRYRLMRDVLKVDADDAMLSQARLELDACPQVQVLAAGQHPDGSWGRFHSQDSSTRKRLPTTEQGVCRALALGLHEPHPVVAAAIRYCEKLLEQPHHFPDPPENNDRWSTGIQLFTAGTLALLAPHHPTLKEAQVLWTEVLAQAFAEGSYNAEAEARAQRELTTASVVGSYLVLSSRYSVALLASAAEVLAPSLLGAYLAWLWNRPDGIGYLCQPLAIAPPVDKPQHIEHWLTSLELLSRYPGWLAAAGPTAEAVLNWLISQRNERGRWDFGGRSSGSCYFPLSLSWRKKGVREHDWTLRVLALLAQC